MPSLVGSEMCIRDRVSVVRPWRTALQRERRLPSGVVGPVLFSALRRLASICLRELIENQAEQLGWFRLEDGPGSRRGHLRPCRLRYFACQSLIHLSPIAEVLRGEGAFPAIESRLRSVDPSDACSTMQPRHHSGESRDDEYGRAAR